jgi:hypothetical protein
MWRDATPALCNDQTQVARRHINHRLKSAVSRPRSRSAISAFPAREDVNESCHRVTSPDDEGVTLTARPRPPHRDEMAYTRKNAL